VIAGARVGRVWMCTTATDLRLGCDGLVHIVVRRFGKHLLDGDLFVFTNRRRTRAKALLWEGTGLCIFAKDKVRPQRTGHGPNPQRNLPIELHERRIDESDLMCPARGDGMSDMGVNLDTEQITIIQRTVVRQVHRRQKVRCQT
jgi:transposase